MSALPPSEEQGDLFAATDPVRRSLPQAELTLWRHFLSTEEAAYYRQILFQALAWEQSVIQVYGRRVQIPRLNAWYADRGCDYRYSGLSMTRHDWHPALLSLKAKVEDRVGHRFNSVLANCYRDGNDSVGWHADDERELGRNPLIASLSLGASRQFVFKHRQRRELPREALWLTDGALLLMGGEMQHFWYHALPKAPKVTDLRINLTFRQIYPQHD